MKIGELARRAAVNIETVRYYERFGLLPAPSRRASGYREYGEIDVKRLSFVTRAKALGFTLGEIQTLLQLSSRQGEDMAGMRETAMEKLADVEARIVELERMRGALKQLIAACPGHGALADCPILEALAGGSRS